MNPLQARLASLRRRMRLQIGMCGVCALTGLVVGAALAVGLADWFLNLPGLIRALALGEHPWLGGGSGLFHAPQATGVALR